MIFFKLNKMHIKIAEEVWIPKQRWFFLYSQMPLSQDHFYQLWSHKKYKLKTQLRSLLPPGSKTCQHISLIQTFWLMQNNFSDIKNCNSLSVVTSLINDNLRNMLFHCVGDKLKSSEILNLATKYSIQFRLQKAHIMK